MQIAIALFPRVPILDAIGPYGVFTRVPGADVVVCAAQKGRLPDSGGPLHVDIDLTFDDVPDPDVLLVPGGDVCRQMARTDSHGNDVTPGAP